MSDINKNNPLPKNVATGDDLDYSFLRKKGQEYIEQLASDLWTDYNSHDPGITIMEMLSYAITDLGTRIQMPMQNILTPSEEEEEPKLDEQFFRAARILPSQPVSEADYRKLFIDIEGVKNCWLSPFDKTVHVDCKNGQLSYDSTDFEAIDSDFKQEFKLHGLYSIKVDFDEATGKGYPKKELEEEEKEKIKDKIRTLYHANRNLCEDLVEITEVEKHPIAVCASIELEPETDEELIHAKILRTIDDYFSPPLKFYSLRQMVDKGYSTDEIFEGPLLQNGFIDSRELENAKLRTEVRLSDLMQLISAIKGVKIIREITIYDCDNPNEDDDPWIICVEDGKKPVRCEESAWSYYKGVLPVNISQSRVNGYLAELEEAEREEQVLAKTDMELPLPGGVYMDTSETTTIQNDFPDTYGIGPYGLPSRVEKARKSHAKQLKGYLLFFDQILASYFAHLGKVKNLLSVDHHPEKTYFTQAVEDIPGFEEIVKNYPSSDPDALAELFLSELDDHIERKNKILDHLVARFAEKFGEYAFLMKQLYGDNAPKAVLNSKEAFLRDYDETSRSRGEAFNYFRQPETELWDTPNVAGVQKRIARLAGIKDIRRRNVPDSFVEVYHFDDSDGKKVYRWRIKDTEGNIILSATENYGSNGTAEKELYLAVVKIIQTTAKTIETGFEKEIVDEDEVGNFEIQVSESGKYSFDVIDREAPPYSSKRIIARQYSYYDSQEDLKQAILDIISFFMNDFNEECMFLVEHILLRPDVESNSPSIDRFMPICADDCTDCHPVDPYSYRLTVVLPGWAFRFANADFRTFLENLIRKEIPAHILPRICWIGDRKGKVPDDKNDMLNFQQYWKEFLFSKTDSDQAQNKDKLINLIEALNELNSIYPTGQLIDCKDEDEELKGRIVLGRTNIGNL